jgi:UDP-N-acetylglucosamine 2-epimerase (non-hydrolysing)
MGKIMKKRIGMIFGTRPEVIKLSPLMNAQASDIFEYIFISTGQQESLNHQALEDFDIHPHCSLGLMKPNQSLNTYLSNALNALEGVLAQQKIDYVMVHGDTGTALAAALASYNLKIPVIHIEAGLRSHDVNNPFPEEMNRKLVSQIATYNFAPTEIARQNLLAEGVPNEKIFVVGNTIVDVVNHVLTKYNRNLKDLPIVELFKKYEKNVLFTVHRRENHKNLDEFARTLESLVSISDSLGLWVPVHPNPNVREKLIHFKDTYPNLHILEPLDYLSFLAAEKYSNLIVTDSGGIQEEATVLKKYCLVLRETTERPELISSGWGELTKFDSQSIKSRIIEVLDNLEKFKGETSPFGDGTTGLKIHEILEAELIK